MHKGPQRRMYVAWQGGTADEHSLYNIAHRTSPGLRHKSHAAYVQQHIFPRLSPRFVAGCVKHIPARHSDAKREEEEEVVEEGSSRGREQKKSQFLNSEAFQ